MKILISAFTPFNGRKSNRSSEILKLLENEYESIVLETSYFKCSPLLKSKINEIRPDFVIMLGESDKCDGVAIERLAINFSHADIPDNEGRLLLNQRIDTKGPDLLETKIDLSEIEGKFKISYHAGTYVCNYLYYQILREYRKSSLKAVFIHVSTKKAVTIQAKDIQEFINLVR